MTDLKKAKTEELIKWNKDATEKLRRCGEIYQREKEKINLDAQFKLRENEKLYHNRAEEAKEEILDTSDELRRRRFQ